MSFAELIQQFDFILNAADASLDCVDHAWATIAGRTSELGLAMGRIARREDGIRYGAMSDGWLAAEALFAEWHPAARRLHEEGTELGKNDPVGALDDQIARAESMVEEMEFVLDAVELFRKERVGLMRSNVKSLRQAGRRVDWIGQAMLEFSDELDQLAKAGVGRSVLAECEMFRDDLHDEYDRVAYALELALQARDELPKLAIELRHQVEDVRRSISRELGIDGKDILTECDEWNPDLLLDEVVSLKRAAETSLDKGEVELAADAVQAARGNHALAGKLVDETSTAHKEFTSRHAHSESLAKEASGLAADGLAILSALRNQYAEMTLRYEPGNEQSDTFASVGKTMPRAVQAMEGSVAAASGDYGKGWILYARNHLIDAEENYQFVKSLHDGLVKRQADLVELGKENVVRLQDAFSSLAGMREAMQDPRVCDDTLAAFEQLEVLAQQAQSEVEAPFGEANPYRAQLALDELAARLQAMEQRIAADREAYDEAGRILAATESSAADAGKIVRVSQTDGVPDSTATHKYAARIETCVTKLKSCRSTLEAGHSNWRELIQEVNRQRTRLGEAVAGLKDELRRARQAVDSIRAARKTLNRAIMWSGSYGVRISGSLGSSHLQEAHDHLSMGRYSEASRIAAFARTRARQAIAAAEAREATIRRQREAEARRRRRLSSFSSSSGFGGSSSSFGSSSSSSGFSSSSFSSGSGFSRSGW